MRGLSRNSFWRRFGWFLRHLILYGEFRWKHASDSINRVKSRSDRTRTRLENKELIKPRRDSYRPAASARIAKLRVKRHEPERSAIEQTPERVRLVHPAAVVPAPHSIRKEKHSQRGRQ